MRAFHVDDPEAKILYRLHGDNIPSNDAHFFQINADSGNLTTKRYIDRPVGSIYEVVVIAYTYNNDIGYINLTIRVTEYNKFPPHFLLSNYRIEVGLLTPLGTELAVVHAADNDREPYNAEVYYMLQSRSSLINVHRSTGSVTLKENLSPRFRDLVFTIIAYDGGSPHRIARTKLTMTVKLISVPQNVVVEHTGDQWAMLCWQPPASGVPLGYIISLTTDFVSSVLTTRNITVNELGYKNGRICTALADLESWSNFEARIAGWNGEETGMMSPSVEFNTRVNNCPVNVCEHGECIIKQGSTFYHCKCKLGFYGIYCDKYDPCFHQPCTNSGTCYSLNNSEFKCSCSAGFYGTNCSLFNPCDRSVSPCLNGGKCFSNTSNQFDCECPSGYFGKSCEIYNPCSLAQCQHGSTCYNETATTYACKCLRGYTGVFCEVDIDECANKPCLNGGSCSDEIGSFKCTCRTGFEGERCEINIDECKSNLCKNNGTCTDGEASFTCRCQPGYTGSFCETDIDECLSNPCENNGTCINNVASYSCICGPGYEGDYCDEEINECISWPCFNGGTCIDALNDYKCVCSSGFTGIRCEIDIDLCASKPCKNGGTCVDNTHSVTCQCVTGFRGQFCQIKEECHLETVLTSRGKFTWSNLEFDNIAISDCPYGATTNETLLDLMKQKSYKRSASFREKRKPGVWKVDILEVDEEYLYATAEKKEQRRLQLEKRLQMSSLQIGRAFAVRSCILNVNGSAVWAVMQDTLCREEGFNAAEELSQNLENLTKVPSHISTEMFLKATSHIHQIVNFALQDRKIAQTMITVLSNMLDVNGTVLDEADRNGSLTKGLLNAIDMFTKEVHLSPHSNISFTSPNIALQVFSFSPSDTELYNNGISYRPSYLNSSVKMDKTSLVNSEPSNEIFLQNENDVSIIVPREAIQRAVMGSNDIRVQFISFSNKKLFRSNNTSDITGQVITASIKNISITNLTEPVIYNLQNIYGYQKQICVYWDMERSEWKTNGILTNQSVEWINCQSIHLTAFSVLLDPSPDGSRVKSLYAHHEATLTTISYVGAVLSIVGLLFTIFTYAMFRCLNRDRAGKILLNLCFSLLLMNISYLLLSLKENVQNYFEQTDICMVVALSIHYLVLTSLAWMLVEAVNMYQLLITVFASSETRFMMKRMLFAWGIPLCIVGATLSYTGLNNYKSLDPEICIFSPQNHNIYYISYIGPACTILFINCVVFLRVSRVLCQRRSIGKYSTNSKGGVTAAQVRGAFTVMTLLGVTWIVGVFAVGKLRLVFQYVFCISNSLQGFIIFVVRCVQYPEAQSAWSTLFRTGHLKKHRGPSKAGFGPSSHTSSTQQTRATGKADLTDYAIWGGVRPRSHQAEIVRRPTNSLTLPHTVVTTGPTPLISRSRSLQLSDDGCTSSKEGEDTSWRFVLPVAPQDQGYETAEHSPESPRQKPHQVARLTVSTPERLHGSPPPISIIARSDGEMIPTEPGHSVYPTRWKNDTSTSSSTSVSSPTPSPPLTTPSISPTPSYDHQGWIQMPLVGISCHKLSQRIHCEELL